MFKAPGATSAPTTPAPAAQIYWRCQNPGCRQLMSSPTKPQACDLCGQRKIERDLKRSPLPDTPKRATTEEIKALAATIEAQIRSVHAGRHEAFAESRKTIHAAAIELRRLRGILEVRQLRGEGVSNGR